MSRIKYLITCHYSYKIICIRKINDIMSPTWNHVNCFDFVTAYFKRYRLSSVNISLLDQAMTMHNNKLLPLAVVQVLAFGDAKFISSQNVHLHLTPHIC